MRRVVGRGAPDDGGRTAGATAKRIGGQDDWQLEANRFLDGLGLDDELEKFMG